MLGGPSGRSIEVRLFFKIPIFAGVGLAVYLGPGSQCGIGRLCAGATAVKIARIDRPKKTPVFVIQFFLKFMNLPPLIMG